LATNEQSSPVVVGGVLWIGTADGHLDAFDPASGALLWVGITGGPVVSSPAVADGVVYVGSDDGNLYAFDLNAGPVAPARPRMASLRPNYALGVKR
jgi:outer membrane protein assembly factor BamB